VFKSCIAAGFVGGQGFAVDASLIAADANKQCSIPGTDLRDIAVAGAQQRPGELRGLLSGYYVERHGPSRLDGRCRRKSQSLRFIGAAHLCALTRSAVAVKFWCRRYVMAIIVFMDEIAQPGGLQEACS
jgi:hypothetical protein